jgi:hypothetical protein
MPTFKFDGRLLSELYNQFNNDGSVAISSHGLLGLIFFEETVNSERYLSMLHSTFVPHLLCYRLAVTNSVVHAAWSQAAHSKCRFGLSA